MRSRKPSQAPVPPDPAERPPAADLDSIREAALRMLERRRRSRSELARRLREKGHDPPAIETVLDRLAEVGLVDDVDYARAWLRERWGRKAAGRRRLEQELRGRGISSEAIAEARAALETEVGPMDEIAAARRVIEQAARRHARLDPRARRQRVYALLARRGFDGDVIRQALEIPEEAAPEE